MNTSNISFRVSATGSDLRLRVLLDGQEQHTLSPGPEPTAITVEINDDIQQEHVLEIVMSGKTQDHTRVSESGEITSDRVIEITDVRIDDIELGYVFVQTSRYHHDTNGSTGPVDQEFHGVMGCNGTVRFPFTTPVYLWLLEKM